jgi:hypothetical protein
MVPALAVEADLSLTVEGQPVSISGSGEHLTISIRTVRGAIAVLRNIGVLADLIEPLGSRVVDANISADVETSGVVVARLGPYVEPNALSRRLGVAPARIYPKAVTTAAYRDFRS